MSHCAHAFRPASFGPLGAAALAGAIAFAPMASAADLDPGYAEVPQQQVTFGSGWYIRGDIGATRLPSMNIVDPALPTSKNQFVPNAPTESITSGSKLGYVASLGAGYQINNWFRADIIGDYRERLAASSAAGNGKIFCPTGVSYPNATATTGDTNYGTPSYVSGGCSANYQANLSNYDVLVNGYIDLGNWYSVTPYVGAGIGMSFGHYQSSSAYIQSNNIPYQISYTDAQYGDFYNNYDRTSSGTYYNLAWALMGGFAVDVYSHTKLDVGYRYLSLGQIPGISKKLSSQEVRAGLRYMIDN